MGDRSRGSGALSRDRMVCGQESDLEGVEVTANIVNWADLGLLTTAIMVTGGTLISVFLWIYRELNTLRTEISSFRVEVAKTYVSSETLGEVEGRLEKAVEKLGDRLDRSIENLMAIMRKPQ